VRALLERRVEQMHVSDAGERAADLIACLDGLALAHVVAAVAGQDALARSVKRVVVGLLG
jgi:ABC-type xylose transport system substrate-binding protein